jgi:hypothetical protein
VSGFSAGWLATREPFDAAARSAALVEQLRANISQGTEPAPLGIVDLGAGTGANLRYLAPLLGGTQHWRLVDNDSRLLDSAITTTRAWAEARGASARVAKSALAIRNAAFSGEIRCHRADLAELHAVELPVGGLVTASALLDLVSHAWLEDLARLSRAARAAVCFALTYDGRTIAKPAEPEDAAVLALFNRHQLFDKGFGPALGMRAALAAEAAFEAHGYELRLATSDWVIGPEERALQLALLEGWLAAALEVAPESRLALTSWHERRCAHVLHGRSALEIGHVDIVGWL